MNVEVDDELEDGGFVVGNVDLSGDINGTTDICGGCAGIVLGCEGRTGCGELALPIAGISLL